MDLTGNGCVVIGAYCDIAPNVSFITGSHKIGKANHRAGEGYNGTITVGDGVWIGAGVMLLPNIQIESGTVVGAGTIVNKNLKENRVYVGNPAREIKILE